MVRITSRRTIPITTTSGTLLRRSLWVPRAYPVHKAVAPVNSLNLTQHFQGKKHNARLFQQFDKKKTRNEMVWCHECKDPNPHQQQRLHLVAFTVMKPWWPMVEAKD
ncbi:hypothetical protein B296_00031663 [Ensete ventricosum]|uniref:Uncharacterized protein n=1 Tax=Ensete ventricosum TaxID=4639 RepID=A0A426Y2L2_ENSVE|nr:hypothetical protein B296_00031663 [Ensete ventricosum]